MSKVVIFDKDASPQRVITVISNNADTAWYEGRDDVVVFGKSNPPSNLGPLNTVPRKYWKHESGQIVEMTQPEKDAEDVRINDLLIQNSRQFMKNTLVNSDQGKLIQAICSAFVGYINELRSIEGLMPITNTDFLNTVTSKIDAGEVD